MGIVHKERTQKYLFSNPLVSFCLWTKAD